MRILLTYVSDVRNPATRLLPRLVLRLRLNGVSTCVILIFFRYLNEFYVSYYTYDKLK